MLAMTVVIAWISGDASQLRSAMLVVSVMFVLGVAISLVAFAYSRYVFGGYVRKAHPEAWERLAGGDERSEPTWSASDVTDAMYRFRVGDDDLGDPRVRGLRLRSHRLYAVGMVLILTVPFFLTVLAAVALIRYFRAA